LIREGEKRCNTEKGAEEKKEKGGCFMDDLQRKTDDKACAFSHRERGERRRRALLAKKKITK